MKTELVFPTPIWIDDNVGLNRQPVIDFVNKVREEDPKGRNLSNIGGWQSHDFIHEVMGNNPLYEIRNKILERVYAASDEWGFSEYSLRVTNLWINVNTRGHSNAMHTHPCGILSGVYYLSVPDCCSGVLTLFRDFNVQNMRECWGVGNNFSRDNLLAENTVTFDPKTDSMIIFPSWVPHNVSSSASDNERISMSFNIQAFSNHYEEIYPSRRPAQSKLSLKT